MEETYNLEAVVLNRYVFRESDSRVILYSRERGKLELVARGTKKIKSKIAPHIEPLNLIEVMAIRGKKFDYLGSAMSRSAFYNIKSDLDLLTMAGRAVKVFDQAVKSGVADVELFDLLKDYLVILNSKIDSRVILNSFFIFKLLISLGYKPELYHCVNCGGKVSPQGLKFDLAAGGLVCVKCSAKQGMAISENSVKLLRLMEKSDLRELTKIKIAKKNEVEVENIVGSFLNYNLHF